MVRILSPTSQRSYLLPHILSPLPPIAHPGFPDLFFFFFFTNSGPWMKTKRSTRQPSWVDRGHFCEQQVLTLGAGVMPPSFFQQMLAESCDLAGLVESVILNSVHPVVSDSLRPRGL